MCASQLTVREGSNVMYYAPPLPTRIHPWVPTVWWEGEGKLCKPPPPPRPPPCDMNPSTQHTQHSCKDTYTAARIPTYLHTTTHNNNNNIQQSYNTRVHKITNAPVVYMALILNGFEACNIITRGIGRGGP